MASLLKQIFQSKNSGQFCIILKYFGYINWRTLLFFLLAAICVVFFPQPAVAQNGKGKEFVQASLVADTSVVIPGKPFRVGLYLQMKPGWHIYWQNPGDAGLPPTIEWKLPAGFHASSFQWPIPHRNIAAGDIVDYGYENHVLLITEIRPPSSLNTEEVVIQGHVTWLVCEKTCIPGEADVSLILPVGPRTSPQNIALFKEFEQRLPVVAQPPFPLAVSHSGKEMQISARPDADIKSLSFYPLPEKDQKVGRIVEAYLPEEKTWKIQIPVEDDLEGVLVTESQDGKRKGYTLAKKISSSPFNLVPSNASQPHYPAAIKEGKNGAKFSPLTLLQAILYGFLGGLILNLMPCVFPVISLKIFGFIQQAGEKRAVIFRHGLAFAAGVFTWFFILATIVVLLQQKGHSPDWAFQFQNPTFNFIIIAIVFVFALNLLGVFEIFLPSSTTTGLSQLAEKRGLWGSFFQGCFATLLATPCTAPFLGVALGFALNQSSRVVVFLIFASVALGLALPYVLLSARIGWLRFVPRPGPWMERTKQFMAFPLFATVVWLLMVLGSQRGLSAVIATLGFLLCLAFCGWMIGNFARVDSKYRRFFLLVSLGIASLAAFLIWPEITGMKKASGIPWKPYSESALQEALAAGKPVFVDFTADWCLSCKFNEKTAIERPAVIKVFGSRGIVPLKADWTNRDPVISAVLRSFGRAGVPFYLYYPAGQSHAPLILPELLTESILLETLKKK